MKSQYNFSTVCFFAILTVIFCENSMIRQNAFKYVKIYGFKELNQTSCSLEDVVYSKGFSEKHLAENYTFVLYFDKKNENVTTVVDDIRKSISHVLKYFQRFHIYFGVVDCNPSIEKFCQDKSSDQLYYPFKDEEGLLVTSLEEVFSQGLYNYMDIIGLSIGKNMFKFDDKSELLNFIKGRIKLPRKIPILVGEFYLASEHYLMFLEIVNLLKTDSMIAIIENTVQSTVAMKEMKFLAIDPRRCKATEWESCITWQLPSMNLTNYAPLDVTCQIMKSFFQVNNSVIDGRTKKRDLPRIIQMLLRHCQHVIILAYDLPEAGSDPENHLSLLGEKLTEHFAKNHRFLVLKVNRDHLFQISPEVAAVSYRSDIFFISSMNKELKVFRGNVDVLDEVVAFVEDQIALSTSPPDEFNFGKKIIDIEIGANTGLSYLFESDEIAQLDRDLPPIEDREVSLWETKDVSEAVHRTGVSAILFCVSWNPSCNLARRVFLSASRLLTRSSDNLDSSRNISFGVVSCHHLNDVCDELHIQTYPLLKVFFTDQDGVRQSRNYGDIFSVEKILRRVKLLAYPPVVHLENEGDLHTLLEDLTPLVRHVIIGVNLQGNAIVAKSFSKAANKLHGIELFVTTSVHNLPKAIQDKLEQSPSTTVLCYTRHRNPNVIDLGAEPDVTKLVNSIRSSKFRRFFRLTWPLFEEVKTLDLPLMIIFVHRLTEKNTLLMNDLKGQFQSRALTSYIDLNHHTTKNVFKTYGCEETPCLVLVNLKKESVYRYDRGSMFVGDNVHGWLTSVLGGDLLPSYVFTKADHSPKSWDVNFVDMIYAKPTTTTKLPSEQQELLNENQYESTPFLHEEL